MPDRPDSKQWRALQPTWHRQTRAASSEWRHGHPRHAIDSTHPECPESGTKTPAKRREKKFCEDGFFRLMAPEIRIAVPTSVIRRSAREPIFRTGVVCNASAKRVSTAHFGRESWVRKVCRDAVDRSACRAIDTSQLMGKKNGPEFRPVAMRRRSPQISRLRSRPARRRHRDRAVPAARRGRTT